VLRRMVFVREEQSYPDFRVGDALRVASWFYPNWSEELARHLLADFGLPPRRRIRKLSRGMRSVVGIVVGLAARAELTLFDEPYAGLDAVARQQFYDQLLTDLAEQPRTVLLSTHLIDEMADLLEHVVILDRGRVVVDAPADDVRGTAVTVNGPATAVEEFVTGRAVWQRRQLGARASVTISGPLDFAAQARQALANIAAVLEEAGGKPQDIVRMTWYVTDKREYLAAGKEIGKAFRDVIGCYDIAMTAVEVKALIEDRAKVEIEATAILPE